MKRNDFARMALRAAPALFLAASALSAPVHAQDETIKIGYAISKTGPNAPGAGITTLPNYQLWVKDVNDAGGIQVGDKKMKIEVVEYDDRSSSEEAVRGIERLVTQDKVDFILPPWGTANNLAVGPIFDRYGYPMLANTAVTDKAPELAKRWPNSYWLLGTGGEYAEALVEFLVKLREEGKIGNAIAMASIADGFGIELSNAGREAFEKHDFELVYDETYPLGTQDLAPVINQAKQANPDVFVSFSYPPDTIGLTAQAQTLGFNPKVFYAGVGGAFPIYKGRFNDAVEGVISLGGVNASSDKVKQYIAHHTEVIGQEPDRWASLVTYASLQALQQAIEKAGTIDREAVSKELASASFDTILGTFSFDNPSRQIPGIFKVGQWQNGEFVGLYPADNEGAATPVFPKPDWPPAQ
jgi:branched-chain amino acid transport system substrate-binding protein